MKNVVEWSIALTARSGWAMGGGGGVRGWVMGGRGGGVMGEWFPKFENGTHAARHPYFPGPTICQTPFYHFEVSDEKCTWTKSQASHGGREWSLTPTMVCLLSSQLFTVFKVLCTIILVWFDSLRCVVYTSCILLLALPVEEAYSTSIREVPQDRQRQNTDSLLLQ